MLVTRGVTTFLTLWSSRTQKRGMLKAEKITYEVELYKFFLKVRTFFEGVNLLFAWLFFIIIGYQWANLWNFRFHVELCWNIYRSVDFGGCKKWREKKHLSTRKTTHKSDNTLVQCNDWLVFLTLSVKHNSPNMASLNIKLAAPYYDFTPTRQLGWSYKHMFIVFHGNHHFA